MSKNSLYPPFRKFETEIFRRQDRKIEKIACINDSHLQELVQEKRCFVIEKTIIYSEA